MPTTFAPTYQLIYGSPGRSLALEIAARLGLAPSVVAAARQNVSAREAQLAEHLAKIDQRHARARARAPARGDASARRSDEPRRGCTSARTALRQREEHVPARLNEELDERRSAQARREIDDVIARLKAKADRCSSDDGVTDPAVGAAADDRRYGRRARARHSRRSTKSQNALSRRCRTHPRRVSQRPRAVRSRRRRPRDRRRPRARRR